MIDPRIDIFVAEEPALLHFGFKTDLREAVAYAKREQMPDPNTHLPVDWESPPAWAKTGYLCLSSILTHFSKCFGFILYLQMVIGQEWPTYVVSLYDNRQNIAYSKRRLRHVLRALRESFNTDANVAPAWWWDALECGFQCVC